MQMTQPTHRQRHLQQHRRERGVVLIVTLVLIVIMGLVGSFAIRNAQQGDRIINGIRSTATAQEGAELGLRYCEQIAITKLNGGTINGNPYAAFDTPTGVVDKVISTEISSENASNAAWRTVSNWSSSSNNLIRVPARYYQSSASPTNLVHAPVCLIQQFATTTGGSSDKLVGFVITARGFSNNAKLAANSNRVDSGSEVWLQSVLSRRVDS